jgi:catalase-peroxidase
MRGGANGARIRLEPQRGWEVNAGVDEVLTALEAIQQEFNGSQSGGTRISLADLIVLAGSAAVEKAAKDAGHDVTVPFTPGRTDASQEQTDVDSFAVLEPHADGFRNYLRQGEKLPPETLLLDRANLLTLSAPEMTVLVGGLRALGANAGGTTHGILTDRPGTLTNDFFVTLLAGGAEWKSSESTENVYDIRDLASGEVTGTATAADLVFGSNSVLRAIAEVYASADAERKFVDDFVAAWVKVMELDRFDIS